MALSDVSRKLVRSDLRSRMNKLTTDEFSDAELNQWLNMAQFDVFVRLSAISNIWYGTTAAISLTATAGTTTAISLTGDYAASKIAKVVKLVLADGTTMVPFVPDNEIHSLTTNSNFDASYSVNWFGEKLYTFVGTSATALSSNAATLYFIRKPDEMTGDNNVFTILSAAGSAGDGKYFYVYLGDKRVTVTGRTTLGTNDEGPGFVVSAVAATQATNLNAALNHTFTTGSGVTATVDTATVTITGASNVVNVDTANLTFANTTSTCVDVPTEFIELVIMGALSKALFKLNMTGEKNQVDSDIAQRFNDIRGLYASEMQIMQAEKVPGLQTPRNR